MYLRFLPTPILLAALLTSTATDGAEPLFAVKMLAPPATGQVESVVSDLHASGVQAVYCRADNLLTDSSAGTRLREFRTLLAKSNIAFHITAPVFLDAEALARDPSLAGIGHLGNPSIEPGVTWLRFVCPNRPDYRRQRISDIVAKVRELRPDGLSLDFIRYFIYWERIQPDQPADEIEKFCFCDHCLHQMQAELGFTFPPSATNRQTRAAWVLSEHREQWTEWKCAIITSMVRDTVLAVRAIAPDIRISLHGVPWTDSDYDGSRRVVAGQDLKQLAPYVDVFSPMCYWHMTGRTPEWVHDVVVEYGRLTGKVPVPSIQAGGPRNSANASDSFQRHLRAALKSPSGGINVFDWNRLRSEREQLRMIQDALAERN